MGRDALASTYARIAQDISIHSPRMGRDVLLMICCLPRLLFQSTLPAWGETRWRWQSCLYSRHFNPLSPHGERRCKAYGRQMPQKFQSTLPAWGETYRRGSTWRRPSISIHSPRMGRDMRRENGRGGGCHFNPLSPHGERRFVRTYEGIFGKISIHSPRMGRDSSLAQFTQSTSPFQSTLPAWGETSAKSVWPVWLLFQSTLPAWGETEVQQRLGLRPCNFNPLSPHGERREFFGRKAGIFIFQSTLPARGETERKMEGHRWMLFQSTLPAWGETPRLAIAGRGLLFQSTLPAWGETQEPQKDLMEVIDFNPLSPHGERRDRQHGDL